VNWCCDNAKIQESVIIISRAVELYLVFSFFAIFKYFEGLKRVKILKENIFLAPII
jgi:hypothetical protein